MSEHKHGTMNTRVQEKTFEGFIKISVRAVITIIVLVIIMAILDA